MNRFAHLLDALIFAPARNTKLRLLSDYFATTPDPDRGWALAALTGNLGFTNAKPAMVRGLAAERLDPLLFDLSYDFVGDLAETVALIWEPRTRGHNEPLHLSAIVEALQLAGRSEVPKLFETWLDRLDAQGRWALIKLVTGGLRVGVSARLAKTALAEWGKVPVEQIEEVWHGLAPPYPELFAWLGQGGPVPTPDTMAAYRSAMLAHPLEEGEIEALDPAEFRAEWKWDGIRVQLVAGPGIVRLFTRTGEEIGATFPDILEAAAGLHVVVDGELLVRYGPEVAPFNDLQQRLNRKTVDRRLLDKFPAAVRIYDILFEGTEDLRPLGFDERRARLEAWYARVQPPPDRFDLSPLVTFATWAELAEVRAGSAALGSEGIMLKRRLSPYLAGRPKGHWYKWKRDPDTVDAVMMYAQRGHGKRSSFFSDFTFGCWLEDLAGEPTELVPVGKAYFGFTDAELAKLDKWVRHHTVQRFGPVAQVEPKLVCELAFDSVSRSTRHKSGLALRFPRIARIRWDKPANEADRVATLAARVK